jgi:nucleotide-binding universal stress UspA family protein
LFERIVVGFDESDGSRDAIALAKALAERLDAELTLAGVVPPPVGGSLMPALPANAFTNLVEQARAGIEEAAAEAGADSRIVQSSSAARGLEELTETLEGDLLVLGCAKADEGRVRAGHKARSLMQGSPCSIALAPIGFRHAEPGFSRIGVAIDGSPESGHALESALAVAVPDGEIQLITVATDFAETWGFWGATYALSELGEASRESAEQILDSAAETVPEGVRATRVMAEGLAPEELRRIAAEGLDLLCLGSRGYGPLRRVLLGSVSSELLHDVGCPVLVVPRGAEPEPDGD